MRLLEKNDLRLPAVGCSIAFLLCELISRPYAEMGIADDWSYVRTADLLARTGHIAYNGWATATLGWQLYFAAGLIKIFGFSFTATRLSTLLIALLTTFLLQRTLVRLGITEANASLGTLCLVLSPLFLMLSATFMTDVPGFFAILLCLYACLRALQAASDHSTILWLLLAVVANCICGSSRQIAWLGVLVLVPSTLWMLRRRRNVLLFGLIFTVLGFAFVAAAIRWFAHQPYVLVESLSVPRVSASIAAHILAQCWWALLETTLLLFPVAALYLPRLRCLSLPYLVGLIVFASAAYILCPAPRAFNLLNPFISDWIGSHATYEAVLLHGTPPTMIPHYTLLGLFSLLCLIAIASVRFKAHTSTPETPVRSHLSSTQLRVLLLPLSTAYALLLVVRAQISLFDRYLLVPMFLFVFFLLRLYQDRLRTRVPIFGWMLLGAMAVIGVSFTHNTFAQHRARVTLTSEVLAAGVPDTSIDFGWEQNSWVELQHSDHINEPRVASTPGAYVPIADPHLPGCHEISQSPYGVFPHLAPRYGVSFDPNACEGRGPFAPVKYSVWPTGRPATLYIVKYPGPWRPESDYALAPAHK